MHNEAAEVLFELKDLKSLWNLHEIASKDDNSYLMKKIEHFIGILMPKT